MAGYAEAFVVRTVAHLYQLHISFRDYWACRLTRIQSAAVLTLAGRMFSVDFEASSGSKLTEICRCAKPNRATLPNFVAEGDCRRDADSTFAIESPDAPSRCLALRSWFPRPAFRTIHLAS